MTPTPPSALLLAAAEAAATAAGPSSWTFDVQECWAGRDACVQAILAAIRPLLEDRLARAEAMDWIEKNAGLPEGVNIELLCDNAWEVRLYEMSAEGGWPDKMLHFTGPTLASAIAAARGSG